ncbi:MAG: hypothetical protein KJ737_03895 [Proteobacteria bacterium]|nr:hypothetical protein [Pseudomonadota bacterium]
MALIQTLLIIGGISAMVMITLNVINILQAGSKKPDGRTMAEILGVAPETATYGDIEKLSRKDKMQLFYAAGTPDFSTFNGEYEARILSGGILGKSSALFTHHVFPTGKITFRTAWIGKAFKPLATDSGIGYNIFSQKTSASAVSKRRLRPMRTSMGPSKAGKDGKMSFLVDYSADNTGTIHSMRDEIRQINDTLFIGTGYMGLGGGPINPAPFALIGPPTEWVGVGK